MGGEAGERRGEVDAVHALVHALGEPPHAHRLVESGGGDERVHAALGDDQRGHLRVGVRVRVRVRVRASVSVVLAKAQVMVQPESHLQSHPGRG